MEVNRFQNNAIFWIEVERIKPNPYQPRRDFDQIALQSLADSIRQYGILQPLVVTRFEIEKEDGGLATEYELISGERRWRASRLAGLSRVPALIREKEDSDKVKLELAIIENLQREDLNPIERAEAFHKLVEDFGFKHTEVAKKVGKSREYVSNSIRLLALPDEIKEAIQQGKITEGHARPLLMVGDRPEEQSVLFKEVYLKKLTVRETEDIARRIAHDKVRKKVHDDPRILGFEKELSDALGTRVRIEQKATGGKITIDFFSDEDLQTLLHSINKEMGFAPDGDVDREQDFSSAENSTEEEESEAVVLGEEKGAPHMGDSSYGESVEEQDVDIADTPERIERKQEMEDFEESLGSADEEVTPVTEGDIESAKFESVKDDTSVSSEYEKSEQAEETGGEESTRKPNKEKPEDDDEDLYSLGNFSL